MTRELLIEGQHVDLGPDTNITLEYVSNTIGDIGKINLSRSYTVKIPKSARNARILDDPGRPGHESERARRFLSARFYRNGIDLIGPAQAYILKATPEGYEIALVWNTLEALQALSQSAASLNDLPNLPTLPWIGVNGSTPDYSSETDGALFAAYVSGLGGLRYPAVNTAPHPSMRVANLVDRILTGAGVPYTISENAASKMASKVILAAPKHNPSRLMEAESGSIAGIVSLRQVTSNNQPTTMLVTEGWEHGWDGPRTSGTFETGGNDTHRVLLNLQAPDNVDLTDCAVYVRGETVEGGVLTDSEELVRAYFKRSGAAWYLYLDEDIKLSGWPRYSILLDFDGLASVTFQAYDPNLPKLAVNRVHKEIDISKDNRFPLQGNLPDIKQWDFIKACAAMYGWVPVIQNGALHFGTYEEVTDTARAYDWTAKVDMGDGEPQELSYTLDGWAQRNILTFQEDAPMGFDPNAELVIDDRTLEESRDLYKLPFAASMQSEARHYKVKDDNTVEDVDIQPRIFNVGLGLQGQTLYFEDNMHGQGLIDAHYTRLQALIRKPVALTVDLRLHEIDLATLDLTRPVYLGQFGRYYAILKIQTSDTGLCKVDFLQLP